MRHVLVTNDFPPKVGGIQSYLWELWRRLPSDEVTVLTTAYPGADEWDAAQPFRVERTSGRWLFPTGSLVRRIDALAAEVRARAIVLDPTLPLAALGPRLELPYVVIGHGAEYVIPARLPGARRLVEHVVDGAAGLLAGGQYVADAMQATRPSATIPVASVPPGVDTERFQPLTEEQWVVARQRYHVPAGAPLVVGVSRLVPRKGFDRLVRAAALLKPDHPDLVVLIAGTGREQRRLQALIDRYDAPVRLVGRVADAELPAFYGMTDVFAMPCHDRWFGLEREGFGIVFVEAAATGVPSVAGASGGSIEAVAHGDTGFAVDAGDSTGGTIAQAVHDLLVDSGLRRRQGEAARRRAVEQFGYDRLATRLKVFLDEVGTSIQAVTPPAELRPSPSPAAEDWPNDRAADA